VEELEGRRQGELVLDADCEALAVPHLHLHPRSTIGGRSHEDALSDEGEDVALKRVRGKRTVVTMTQGARHHRTNLDVTAAGESP
jgi:hypothetical protein